VIQEAIHTCLAVLQRTGQMTQELYDFLEVAYVSLADYVEDDVVRLMTEHRAAAEQLQQQPLAPGERTGTPAWQVLSRTSGLAGQVAQSIAAEGEKLRQQFQAQAAAV